MLNQLVIDDTTYTAETEPTELLQILLRHVDRERPIDNPLDLSDLEMLTLKSWLVSQAHRMEPGQCSVIQQCVQVDPPEYILEAAVGKLEDGAPFIWHSGQPWPPGAN